MIQGGNLASIQSNNGKSPRGTSATGARLCDASGMAGAVIPSLVNGYSDHSATASEYPAGRYLRWKGLGWGRTILYAGRTSAFFTSGAGDIQFFGIEFADLCGGSQGSSRRLVFLIGYWASLAGMDCAAVFSFALLLRPHARSGHCRRDRLSFFAHTGEGRGHGAGL